jgi:hypothetical protein
MLSYQKDLKGLIFFGDFVKHKDILVKAVELNPREVKRFINNVVLAKAVFDKPVDELIVVQALNFRRDWKRFFELIRHMLANFANI